MSQFAESLPQSFILQTPKAISFQLEGIVAQRLQACIDQWWLTAPDANPALLQMFRDRDRQPARNLLPWSGEFVGKYLTSAVLGWRLTRNPQLYQLIARTVDELIAVQDQDGYLGPFPGEKRLIGKCTIPEVKEELALWDLWGHYHCLLGLLLWYEDTQHQPALAACCKLADLLCRLFLDGEQRLHDAGAEEMNLAMSHGLCLLYKQTGNPRYLALVREIEADWQRPPAGDYVRQALAGKAFYEMPKPRWESLHDVQAIAELFDITGDQQYRAAFQQIWWSIYEGDRHNTGGFSSGEQATGNPYDTGAIETCCTVAWMATSVDMLRLTQNALVADELELSMFNGLLGGQSPTGRWWTYNTPMDGVKKASAHDIVFQARPGSPELNCCSVNAPRGLAMLADWAVMTAGDDLVVNFYGPGTITLDWPAAGSLRLVQETTYPLDGKVTLRVQLVDEAAFTMLLRIPTWSAQTSLRLNGSPVENIQTGAYLPIRRTWQNGDIVELELDMRLHFWFGEREFAGKASIYRGPLLLAYDQRYNQMDPDDIPTLDVHQLAYQLGSWEEPLPPWLLLQVRAQDGRMLCLCDFA
ncbi:MAG TPA: glycoside hydrolase family 127 protein, partial [Caldilineaceae bacterium]|nr:glycoside hydrolase family 127 protein [Caldilineaceae bacterium]